MNALVRAGRYAVVAEFVVAVCAIVYLGLRDIPSVFSGAPPALGVTIAAQCGWGAKASTCDTSVMELSPGRYRVAMVAPAGTLIVRVRGDSAIARARQLLVSVAQPTTVLVWPDRDITRLVAPLVGPTLTDAFRRHAVAIPAGDVVSSVTFSSAALSPGQESTDRHPLVVSELAFYESDRGLLSDPRTFFDKIPPLRYHATLIPRVVARLCLFTMIAAFFVPPAWLKKANPIALGAVCFSLCVLDLAVLYSPYTGRDLRAFYASGPLQEIAGSNLNGALWEASRLLGGHGFTVADGLVSWAKMPGYGLFVAVAGLLLGHGTLLDLALSTVWLHVWFFSAALACFVWAAGRLWRPPVVWVVGLIVAMLPKQIGYTQVDSVIPAVALLILAALCWRYDVYRSGRPVPLGLDLFVHAMFALWFVMRPDVLPGWAIVSLALHFRRPWRLAIPAALALTIGLTWAGYKMRYTGEFSPTTSTVGASLLCGLWEVPSRFPWVCSDESYFTWVSTHTPFEAKSQAASGVVVREVVRFWITFPGHFVFMIYNKALRCFTGDVWPGIPTDLQVSIFQTIDGRAGLVVVFVTAIALALAVGYERYRTALLAWALLLNAPVFWIMQTSEGRYYGGAGVALVVAAIPLLLDGQFYRAIATRYRVATAVVAAIAVLAIAAWPVHAWLLHNDALHYWTPFLPASATSWGVIK